MEREDFFAKLYPLQDAVLAAFAETDTEFYLTGGTAASRGYLNHRFSDDLDLFVNDDPRFGLWADRLVASVASRPDWQVSVGLRDVRFVRFLVSAGGVDLKVELVNDVPSGVGRVSVHPVLGRLDTAENILANKLTALADPGYRGHAADRAALRVLEPRSADCITDCDPEDVYRVRLWDTTLACPRFNNSATQITVLVLQNTTGSAVSGHAQFWGPSGALLAEQAFNMGPRAAFVVNTSTIPGVLGAGGTITVSHDGPYGTLVGKAVAVEPATGFTFDTELLPRVR